jgi:hypothetical protein
MFVRRICGKNWTGEVSTGFPTGNGRMTVGMKKASFMEGIEAGTAMGHSRKIVDIIRGNYRGDIEHGTKMVR